MAIKDSMEYILDQITNGRKVKYLKILCDSQAAIMALSHRNINSRMVLEALYGMEMVANKIDTLTLSWVKAHNKTEGNEQADMAAKEGAHKILSNNAKSWPWSYKKQRIAEYVTSEWKTMWENIEGHKHTNFFYKCPNQNKARGILRMARSTMMIWIRAITGFNFLGYHQAKNNSNISKLCRICLLYTSPSPRD